MCPQLCVPIPYECIFLPHSHPAASMYVDVDVDCETLSNQHENAGGAEE